MIPMIYTLKMSTDVAADLADFPLVFLSFLHVDSTGALSLNNTPISPGSDPDLLAGIQGMNANGSFVLLSIGGSSSDSDYQNIIANYDTFLANLTALMSAYGITGVDLDLEATTHPYSDYLSICTRLVNDVSASGLLVTAPPYQDMGFWKDLATNTSFPNGFHNILSYNLQLYGGADYQQWVDGFAGIVQEPQMFLGSGYQSEQNSPDEVQQALNQLLTSFPASIFAFIWRYPKFADGVTAADYAQAIISASATDARAMMATRIRAHREGLALQGRKTA